MPLDQSGVKWSCEPCVRGHRSSKCEHYERIMVRVKKPGRPLSTCPHPPGSCSCRHEKMLMVRIQTNSGCVCEPRFYVTPDGDRIPVDSNGRTADQNEETLPADDRESSTLRELEEQKIDPKEIGEKIPKEQLSKWHVSSWSQPQAEANGQHRPAGINGSRQNGSHPSKKQKVQTVPEQTFLPSELESPSKKQKTLPQQDLPGCCSGSQPREDGGGFTVASAQQYAQQSQSQYFNNGFKDEPLWPGSPAETYNSVPAGPFYGTAWPQTKFGQESLFQYDFRNIEHLSTSNGFLNNGNQSFTSMQQQPQDCTMTHEQCACGEGCTCYACTTHPFNEATTSRFKEIQQILDIDLEEEYPASGAQGFNFESGGPSATQNIFASPTNGAALEVPDMSGGTAMNVHGHEISSHPYQSFIYHFGGPQSFPPGQLNHDQSMSAAKNGDYPINGLYSIQQHD